MLRTVTFVFMLGFVLGGCASPDRYTKAGNMPGSKEYELNTYQKCDSKANLRQRTFGEDWHDIYYGCLKEHGFDEHGNYVGFYDSLSPEAKLDQLNSLLQKGLITEEEYNMKKKEILKDI